MGWKRDALKSCLTMATACGMVLEGFSPGYAQYSSVPPAETRAMAELEGRTTGESAMTIIPSLRLAERYDSNVFFSSGGKLEDYVTTVSPQVRVEHRNQWVEGVVGGGATGEVYVNNPGLNYVGGNGIVDLNLDRAMNTLVRGLGLRISDSISYTPQPPAFAAPTGGNQLSETFVQGIQARRANSMSNFAMVEASYFFSPYVGITSTYTDSRIRFGRGIATPTGVVASGEFINTNFQTLSSGLEGRPSPADTISLLHQYRKATFAVQGRGFSAQGVMAQWSRAITPSIKGMIEGGFSVVNRGDGVYPVGGGSLEWQGQYTSVTVSYSRSVAPSFLFVATALLSQVVTAEVSRQLAESFSISLSAGYAVNQSIPNSSLVRYESYSVTPSIVYKIGANLTTKVSYTHSEFQRASSGHSFEFDRNMIMLTLLYEWR